jgi:ubiquinone biosynthesis protein UbiJ
MTTKTEPKDLANVLRIISDWFDHQAAIAEEDADHWGHVIRARALEEAANELDQLRKKVDLVHKHDSNLIDYLMDKEG